MHQTPPGADKDLNVIRHEQMEENDSHLPLALRYAAHQ